MDAQMKGGWSCFAAAVGLPPHRYVEADRSQVDEYCLGADNTVAEYALRALHTASSFKQQGAIRALGTR